MSSDVFASNREMVGGLGGVKECKEEKGEKGEKGGKREIAVQKREMKV
jgi:hypothetical protein